MYAQAFGCPGLLCTQSDRCLLCYSAGACLATHLLFLFCAASAQWLVRRRRSSTHSRKKPSPEETFLQRWMRQLSRPRLLVVLLRFVLVICLRGSLQRQAMSSKRTCDQVLHLRENLPDLLWLWKATHGLQSLLRAQEVPQL